MLKDDLFRMRDAIDQYYADKNQYPATLDALVTDGYFAAAQGSDSPNSDGSWQAVPAEPDPNNLTTQPACLRREERIRGTRDRRQPLRGLVRL